MILSNLCLKMVAISHIWLLSIWKETSATEEWNFKTLILFSLNLKVAQLLEKC